MTIATEKLNPASERFMLIRLEPIRDISPLLVSLGGGVYSCSFPYEVTNIYKNGDDTLLSWVTTTPTSNDEVFWDETAKTITIKLSSAPSSLTLPMITVSYYIYLTGGVNREAYATPTDSNTAFVPWIGRVTQYPSTSQSISNIFSGVFSIDGTSLTVANSDGYFNQYLTANDSFYKRRIDAWLCVNSISNIESAYRGSVVYLNGDSDFVTFSIVDSFNNLTNPAYMGDTVQEALYLGETSSFPQVYSGHRGLPCRFIASDISKWDYDKSQELTQSFFGAPNELIKFTDYSQSITAVNTDYDDTALAGSDRLNWSVCRTPGSILVQSFPSVSHVLNSLGFVVGFSSAPSNVFVGNRVSWTTGGTPYRGIVVWVGSRTKLGNTYHVEIVPDSLAYVLNTSSVFNNLHCLDVTIDVGYLNAGVPLPIRATEGYDYTVNQTTTSGGNKHVSITMNAGLNGRYPTYGTFILSPETCTMYCRVFGPTNYGHGQLLKLMCNTVGIETNDSTFTAADAAVTEKVAMSIPMQDETEYGQYLDYAEKILSSTLGYLAIGSDFKAEYHLTAAPSGSLTVGKSRYIRDSLSWTLDYQDIISEITATNNHWPVSDSSYSNLNYAAKYLHGVDNPFHFNHVLKSLNSTGANVLKLRSKRRASYTFSTSTVNIDSAIGNDVTLESDKILGGASSDDVKIVSLEKNTEQTTITAIDLEGF